MKFSVPRAMITYPNSIGQWRAQNFIMVGREGFEIYLSF